MGDWANENGSVKIPTAHRQALQQGGMVDQGLGDVRHLIAKTLIDHSALLQGLTVGSRDFH